jgi:hypothetical protein
VFRRDKDVEYTLFLPFQNSNTAHASLHGVLVKLFAGIVKVLNDLGFETSALSDDADELADCIVNDPVMTE